MKLKKLSLSVLAFLTAILSAVASKPMANRNLFTASTGPCHLIWCRTTDTENHGPCPNSHAKFTNNTCTTAYTGQAFNVINP